MCTSGRESTCLGKCKDTERGRGRGGREEGDGDSLFGSITLHPVGHHPTQTPHHDPETCHLSGKMEKRGIKSGNKETEDWKRSEKGGKKEKRGTKGRGRKNEGCQKTTGERSTRRRPGSLARFLETPLPAAYCTSVRVWRHEKKEVGKRSLGITGALMSIYRPCTSLFLLPLSIISCLLLRRYIVCYCFTPPRPFKQGHDEYNDDGPDALYHHLVPVLYEWGPHYHEILIKPLYPSLSSPTLIHAMRLTNPMICLII